MHIKKILMILVAGTPWYLVANETPKADYKKMQQSFDMALEQNNQPKAIRIAHKALFKFHQSRPHFIRHIKKGYKKIFGADPFEVILKEYETHDNALLESQVAEMKTENIKLLSKISMLELQQLQPELQAAQADTQRA